MIQRAVHQAAHWIMASMDGSMGIALQCISHGAAKGESMGMPIDPPVAFYLLRSLLLNPVPDSLSRKHFQIFLDPGMFPLK